MGSNIKGGGKAVMSEESQEALIDLLISINCDDDGLDMADLSLHDRKQRRKQFVKKLVRKYERKQLRRKHNGNASVQQSDLDVTRDSITSSNTRSKNTNPNVRIELAEAIFAKDKNKKKIDKEGKGNSQKKGSEDAFKIGTKKVIVLPRSISISQLIMVAQAKLKMKKKPVCIFLQPSTSMLFELKEKLDTITDGTMIYVSVTPLPKDTNSSDEGDILDEGQGDVIDPLESVKRAYKNQDMVKRQPQCKYIEKNVNEVQRNKYSESRLKLPVASQRHDIISTILHNQVTILSGSTGSGKSTQVPQFFMEDTKYDNKQPYIVVTQPRRVAAISLAQRVANEQGSPPPGSKGSSIGYIVRLDNQVDLRSCRIVYMTIGILLRMLVQYQPQRKVENLGDDFAPSLCISSISCLIIDEVHERDVNTDFTLTLLKRMLLSPSSSDKVPRLVLMSATSTSDLFVNYFTIQDKVLPIAMNIPGRTFPVDIKWLDDCEALAGKPLMMRQHVNNVVELQKSNSNTTKSNNMNALSPRATDRINNNFIRSLVIKIVNVWQQTKGAILIFLPGLSEISALARCLKEGGYVTSDPNICKIMTLHSTTPKMDQAQIFKLCSKVKIVLSTNIAETSLTIPDISHVIDTCLVKESRYNSESRIKELTSVWISHASMTQRSGRAGRTSHGTCWRLCKKEFATEKLLQHTPPEIVRIPLDELILQVCLLYEQQKDWSSSDPAIQPQASVGVRPTAFLSYTPTSPLKKNIVQACHHLIEVDALDVVDRGNITEDSSTWKYRLTPLGYHLSRLPMDAKVGKLLIVGAIIGCFENALTIAAALSCSKSCFLRSSRDRPIDPTRIEARNKLIEYGFGGRIWYNGAVKGDLIALIAVFRMWKAQPENIKNKFCWEHGLDSFAIQELDSLRHQFNEIAIEAGLVFKTSNYEHEDALLTSCCLVAGMYPNICTLVRPSKGGPQSGKLLTKDNNVCIPSSDSFQRKRVSLASENGRDAYAVYHSKHQHIGIISSQGRKRPPETFLSEVNFISKFTLLLFGGQLELINNALVVDGWLKFKVSGDSSKNKGGDVSNAVLILALRELMDNVIVEHVEQAFVPDDKKMAMIARHRKIINVIQTLIADEN